MKIVHHRSRKLFMFLLERFIVVFSLRLITGFDSSGPTLLVDTNSCTSKEYLTQMLNGDLENCFKEMSVADFDYTGLLSSKIY